MNSIQALRIFLANSHRELQHRETTLPLDLPGMKLGSASIILSSCRRKKRESSTISVKMGETGKSDMLKMICSSPNWMTKNFVLLHPYHSIFAIPITRANLAGFIATLAVVL